MTEQCSGCRAGFGPNDAIHRIDGNLYCERCAERQLKGTRGDPALLAESAIVSTTSSLDGYGVAEYLGTVSAVSMLALDSIQDWLADARSWFGGKAKGHIKQFAGLQADVEAKLKYMAVLKGANAVIGAAFDIGFVETATGAEKLLGRGSKIERKLIVSATGTAVLVERAS